MALPDNTIGLHIRRSDHIWIFDKSKDEHYEAVIRAIIAKNPIQKFFLATDVKATEDKFVQMFPDNILVQKKKYYNFESRHSIDSMREAAADLYILSKTNVVLGNQHSCYSQYAAMLGNVKLIRIEDQHGVNPDELAIEVLKERRTE